MTTVYLIRHGTTENNLKGIFQGSIDVALGELGVRQAECLRERMKGLPLAAVYSSPLVRAVQTAQAVCDGHPCLQPIVEMGLTEINGGILEGRGSEENSREYPECMYNMSHRPALFQAPGGESSRAVYDRMVAVMNEIVLENRDKQVAVVSHGFAIQLYLGYVKGVPFEEIERSIVGNSSVSILTYDRELRVGAEVISDESHLPEELRFRVAREFMVK